MFAPMPSDPEFLHSDEFLKMGFPSGGGVSNALGIAKLLAPLASMGKYNGV